MDDRTILHDIATMVDEERALRAQAAATEEEAKRLRHLQEELDRCWDLLRQRRAKREFGENPDTASPRDPQTVENYRG